MKLAEALGLDGDALVLSEKIADSREEYERILEGYLRRELVPFAVKLAERLLEEAPLPPALARLLAERLAPTLQGAALAARSWPELLRENLLDIDGWTLFAEALRRAGREDAAALADGFGAVLSGSTGTAPVVPLRRMVWASGTAAVPPSAVPVTEGTMPRLASALRDTLQRLGAGDLPVMLDVEGGVEAWLSDERLVLGAGALTVFSQAELPALLALTLALGRFGVRLRETGPVAELPAAAVRAFEAYPASLAFSRVLALLDDSVRGGDPAQVELAAVLRQSPAFRAVALWALDSLS